MTCRVTNCTSLKETIVSFDSSVSQGQCDLLSVIHVTLRVEDLFEHVSNTLNTTINWRTGESQSRTTCLKDWVCGSSEEGTLNEPINVPSLSETSLTSVTRVFHVTVDTSQNHVSAR